MAATKDPKLAFVVTLSGPTITPAEQGLYITEAGLRKKGYGDQDIEAALNLDRQIAEVYRTDSGWAEAEMAIEAAKNQKWFADAAIGIQSQDSWNWKWYRNLPFDLDPIPLLENLPIPLLAVHGENDMLVPAERSAETINGFKDQGKDFRAIVFPDVGHGINAGKGRTWEAPAEYWSQLDQWLKQKVFADVKNSEGQMRSTSSTNLFAKNMCDHFGCKVRAIMKPSSAQAKSRLQRKDLTKEQRSVELLKVLAAIRDGHTGMAASSRDKLFGYVPITTEWFEDELRIVRTSSEYQKTLGAKILSVEGTDLAELKKQLLTVVPHANYQRFEKLSPSYLQLPGLLYGLGVTSSPDQARFTLQLQSGEKQEVVFQRMNDEQYKDATFVTTDQVAKSLPLYRQRKDESYWYEYLPDEKLFYFRYNRITSDDEKPIWSWSPQMWAKVDSLDVEKLVIDIRGNGGGGFQFSLPIIQGILDRPNLNQRGKLFVLTGYKTFSAAIGFLEQLENRSNAMIVGVPPCDHPASPGDGDSFLLGETGIKINLSQIFHATIFPDDQRISIGMDQQIPTSWDDYAAGRDPLLTFVKEFQAKETAQTSEKAFEWVGRYSLSPDKVLTISKVDSDLILKIGKFFSTPLYPSSVGRFKTEIVGMEVGLTDCGPGSTVLP